ncbi:hypothetical protein [Arthrobacter sp. JSM 101049]|uniref:hypothetical protein n=1 Tax=Arthrobacter sp. JSM 101049 TaxID=929097 RepID=UPI00356822B0
MKKVALAAVFAIALSASGCASGASGAREAVPATDALAAGSPGFDMEQEIAYAAMNRWLSNEGAHSVEGFVFPFNLITRVEGPARGTIVLYVDNALEDNLEGILDYVPEDDLHSIAAVMLSAIHADFPDIVTITASTEDRQHTATVFASRPGVIAS